MLTSGQRHFWLQDLAYNTANVHRLGYLEARPGWNAQRRNEGLILSRGTRPLRTRAAIYKLAHTTDQPAPMLRDGPASVIDFRHVGGTYMSRYSLARKHRLDRPVPPIITVRQTLEPSVADVAGLMYSEQ